MLAVVCVVNEKFARERERTVLAKDPAQPLAEPEEAAHRSSSKGRNADEIQPFACPDHRRIGAEQHEDERPADAEQNHGANGDGAGSEKEQRGVTLHERRQSSQPPRDACPDQQQDGGGRTESCPRISRSMNGTLAATSPKKNAHSNTG